MQKKNTYITSKEKREDFFCDSFTYITSNKIIKGLLFFSLLLYLIVGVSFTTDFAYASINITNMTVIAKVNVTNTEPNITNVVVDDDVKVPLGEIDLTANNVTVITCNATIWDYNGVNDIISDPKTNATFYIDSMGSDATDDNNHHYTNSSCNRCIAGPDSNTAYCDCRFAILYYANYSDSWRCNFTVTDDGGTQKSGLKINQTDSEVSSKVTVNTVLGISALPLLDYGNLSVTETSPEVIHNVSNVGNVDINFTLRGYGGTNESIGQNVTMICAFGNITFDYQRYEFGTEKIGTTDFEHMYNLTNQTMLTNWKLQQKIEDSNIGHEQNSSIWRLQVPPSVGGICNGTIIFGAVDAS